MAHAFFQPGEPVVPNEKDVQLATSSSQKLAVLLAKRDSNEPISIRINDGVEIVLPLSAVQLLFQLLSSMADGNAVTLIPIHKLLTTQEAADLLSVSRPFLIQLLENGEIPFEKVGTHRRIRAENLFSYQSKLEEKKKVALDELIQKSQEENLGYE